MRRTWWRRLDTALGGMGLLVAPLLVLSGTLGLLALAVAQAPGLVLPAFALVGLAAFAGLLAPVLAYIGWSEAREARDRRQVNLRPSRSFSGPAILPSPRSQARGWRGRPRGLPDDFGRT